MMYPLCIVVTFVFFAQAATLPPNCPKGKFVKDNSCVPCTLCPNHQYIERSCSDTEDTICAILIMKRLPWMRQEQDTQKDKMKRNATKEIEDTFTENATECFLKAREEDIMIKLLMAALVMVTLTFVGYVIVTKCCQHSAKDQADSCDALISTTTLIDDAAERYIPGIPNYNTEPNFVVTADGRSIPEEQYLRRALTGKGRSQALVLVNNAYASAYVHEPRIAEEDCHSSAACSVSLNNSMSENSVSFDA